MDAFGLPERRFHKTRQLPEGFRIEASKSQPVASKMYIGGLSYEISKQALLDYLSQFGDIADFVIKTHPGTRLPRGFGFVLFKDNATVEKVLQVKEHRVGGRKIELKRAKVLESKFSPRKIFVGGLNPRMSEGKIRQYFGTFGMIENIELPVFPETNERRAFCFISYADETAVRRVLQTRFHFIGCGRCEVKIAFQDEMPKLHHVAERDVPLPRQGSRWGEGESPANPNAYTVDQNVCGPVGGSEGPPTMLLPVTFTVCNQGFNFSDQNYDSFYSAYSNQADFNYYSGQYFLGCYSGTHTIGTTCTTYYNEQINTVVPYGTGYQGIYHLF